MRVLLFGSNGQVGSALKERLSGMDDVELIALDREDKSAPSLGLNDLRADLSDPEGIEDTLRRVKPDVIINAAAYTDVDGAEDNEDYANTVNAASPAVMAKVAAETGALMIHFSTDYVYSDDLNDMERPWTEDDEAVPLNKYGSSKLSGDKAIMRSGARHLIFRTGGVYSDDPKHNNFIKSILGLASKGQTFDVVDDQVGGPTSARLLADVTAHAVLMAMNDHTLSGLYNIAPEGFVSRYDLARFALRSAMENGLPVRPDQIRRITSSAYYKKAQRRMALRPLNARLNASKFVKKFGFKMPPWEKDVKNAVGVMTAHYAAKLPSQSPKPQLASAAMDGDQP